MARDLHDATVLQSGLGHNAFHREIEERCASCRRGSPAQRRSYAVCSKSVAPHDTVAPLSHTTRAVHDVGRRCAGVDVPLTAFELDVAKKQCAQHDTQKHTRQLRVWAGLLAASGYQLTSFRF